MNRTNRTNGMDREKNPRTGRHPCPGAAEVQVKPAVKRISSWDGGRRPGISGGEGARAPEEKG